MKLQALCNNREKGAGRTDGWMGREQLHLFAPLTVSILKAAAAQYNPPGRAQLRRLSSDWQTVFPQCSSQTCKLQWQFPNWQHQVYFCLQHEKKRTKRTKEKSYKYVNVLASLSHNRNGPGLHPESSVLFVVFVCVFVRCVRVGYHNRGSCGCRFDA